MSPVHILMIFLKLVFLGWGEEFLPKRHLAISGDIFWLAQLGVGEAVTNIQWVKAIDASKHLAMPRTAHQRIIQP